MIAIIPKPTDTHSDNSTGMVIEELRLANAPFELIDLDRVDPFNSGIENYLIWVCGLRQEEHQFETLNALSTVNRVVNTPAAIATCASKVHTSALLHRNGIKSPKTCFTSSREMAASFIAECGNAVYKPVYGYDGNGIILVTKAEQLGFPPYYLQEYVPNDRDFRVFVIEGAAVGAIERVSDSLTHNIHQGGCGAPCEIDREMGEITSNAARAVGVDYAGVDLLLDHGEFTVLEVNGTPNWHCMSAPIPKLLAHYLIREEHSLRA